MISLLRGLMSSDGNTNRPLPSLILLGIVDFVCILMAAEAYRDKHVHEAAIWLSAGVASSVIGYYWPQIRRWLSLLLRRKDSEIQRLTDEIARRNKSLRTKLRD